MRHVGIISFIVFGAIAAVGAQDTVVTPELVAEYPVSSKPDASFVEASENPYGETGMRLACDMSGRLYFIDYEKKCINIIDDMNYQVLRSFSVKPFPYDGDFMGDDDGIYYVSGSGYFEYISNTGEVLFSGFLKDIMPFPDSMQIASSYYHAGIWFFSEDRTSRVHCIINPSTDKEQNSKNYRNPEQTKKLFAPDSGIDLQGLSLTEDRRFSRIFLNGKYIGPGFQPLVGDWIYSLGSSGTDLQNVSLYNIERGFIRRPVPRYPEYEKPQGVAVHPSGDIFLLRYDTQRKCYVLYRIENTWDPETRKAWFSRKR